MNPEMNTRMNDSVTTEPQVSTPHPVNQITPVSKYLAMTLFILLPFVGGYVGYELAHQEIGQTVIEQSNLYEPNQSSNAPVLPNSGGRSFGYDYENNVSNIPPPQIPTLNEDWPYRPYATDILRYVPADQDTSDFWENRNDYPNSISVNGVRFIDADAQKVSDAPFLRVFKKTQTGYILTLPCFIESECGDGGLYKYDAEKKEVSTMKGSSHYYPMMTGGELSPDGNKIAVVDRFSLGVIDLVADTYSEIITLDYKENKTFSICEMGCYSDVNWMNDKQLQARIFEYEQCSADGMCTASYTDASGKFWPTSTIPRASSTSQFSL